MSPRGAEPPIFKKKYKMNVFEAFKGIKDYFSPRVIAELEDSYVKLALIKGDDIPWHSHDNEDELFYVFSGQMTIELESGEKVNMKEGDLYVVPKKVKHRVYSEEECRIMLIEKKTTQHTGDIKTDISKSIEDQLY